MHLIISRWHEKTKLLSTHKTQNKYEKFEVSPLQHLKNVLADKEALIRRTRLTSVARGNAVPALGKIPVK